MHTVMFPSGMKNNGWLYMRVLLNIQTYLSYSKMADTLRWVIISDKLNNAKTPIASNGEVTHMMGYVSKVRLM